MANIFACNKSIRGKGPGSRQLLYGVLAALGPEQHHRRFCSIRRCFLWRSHLLPVAKTSFISAFVGQGAFRPLGRNESGQGPAGQLDDIPTPSGPAPPDDAACSRRQSRERRVACVPVSLRAASCRGCSSGRLFSRRHAASATSTRSAGRGARRPSALAVPGSETLQPVTVDSWSSGEGCPPATAWHAVEIVILTGGSSSAADPDGARPDRRPGAKRADCSARRVGCPSSDERQQYYR